MRERGGRDSKAQPVQDDREPQRETEAEAVPKVAPSEANPAKFDARAIENERVRLPSAPDPDVVEVALADALRKAAAAGAWEQVGQLAREFEARRKARSETVDLATERARRR